MKMDCIFLGPDGDEIFRLEKMTLLVETDARAWGQTLGMEKVGERLALTTDIELVKKGYQVFEGEEIKLYEITFRLSKVPTMYQVA